MERRALMASKKGTREGAEEDMLAMWGLLAVVIEMGIKVVGVEVESREDDASLSRCRADVERGLRAMRDKEGRRDCI